MTKVLDFLVEQQEITIDRKLEIQHELQNPRFAADKEGKKEEKETNDVKKEEADANGKKANCPNGAEKPEIVKHIPRCGELCESARRTYSDADGWSLAARLNLFPENSLNRRMAEIILSKQTNLCLALDLDDKQQIIEV
jgi:hypothetical protein